MRPYMPPPGYVFGRYAVGTKKAGDRAAKLIARGNDMTELDLLNKAGREMARLQTENIQLRREIDELRADLDKWKRIAFESMPSMD